MSRKAVDITGKRFGRLVALECVGKDKYGKALWLCKCDCGNEAVVAGSLLRRGTTQSCGCIANELRVKNFMGAHRTHGGSKSRLYYVWHNMRTRCERENNRGYKWYGALGVSVCDEWQDFGNFQEWAMKSGYDPNAPRGECTLDRIDPCGNYEPSNCRWVPMSVQRRNRRDNRGEANREALAGTVTAQGTKEQS